MGRGYTAPILPAEEDILFGDDGGHGVTDLQYKLFGLLRRSMSRKTGVAGEASRISYSGLRQRLYQHSRRGFSGTGDAWGKEPRQQDEYIRRQVRVLVDRGLIDLVTDGRGLLRVLFKIYLKERTLYFSAQNKPSANPPQSHGKECGGIDSKNNGLVDSDNLTIRNQNAIPSALPEVTSINIDSSSLLDSNTDQAGNPSTAGVNKKFAMNDAWHPSDAFVQKAAKAGFKVSKGASDRQLAELAVIDMQAYWTSPDRATAAFTQDQWESKLLMVMVRFQGGNVTPITMASAKRDGAAVRAVRIPRNVWGEALQAFGIKHGFRAVKVGEEDVEYRRALQVHLEHMNHKQERAHG